MALSKGRESSESSSQVNKGFTGCETTMTETERLSGIYPDVESEWA